MATVDAPTTSVGRRVAYWRNRRRMSQQVFADLLGKSKSWVDKIERGARRLDRFSTIVEIADLLGVDRQTFLTAADHQPTRSGANVGDVDSLRAAVERASTPAVFLLAPAGPPPPLADVRRAVEHAWAAFGRAHYDQLTRLLPGLLHDGHAVDDAGLLAEVYQLASAASRKLGDMELGWMAADRAVRAAHRSGDPALVATSVAHVAAALFGMGRARPALELCVHHASHLAPSGADTPGRLAGYGLLLGQAAESAARTSDRPAVVDLLRGADEAAQVLDGDLRVGGVEFGPTVVEVRRAACAVGMTEDRLAVEVHDRLDPAALGGLSAQARAGHLLVMARAYLRLGDVPAAVLVLLECGRLAPQDLRLPAGRAVVADVAQRGGSGLALLADVAA